MSQFRHSFGEAKSLAQLLADTDQCEYGVMTTDGVRFLIESEFETIYSIGKAIDADSIVFVATPGASKEEIFREALETIAYPANWPSQGWPEGTESLEAYANRTRLWMQSVAANALTNSGKV